MFEHLDKGEYETEDAFLEEIAIRLEYALSSEEFMEQTKTDRRVVEIQVIVPERLPHFKSKKVIESWFFMGNFKSVFYNGNHLYVANSLHIDNLTVIFDDDIADNTKESTSCFDKDGFFGMIWNWFMGGRGGEKGCCKIPSVVGECDLSNGVYIAILVDVRKIPAIEPLGA